MKRVIIESPYEGDIALNEMYCEFCLHDSLVNHGESPYASHLLYTRDHVLRDHIAEERKLGIEAGFFWRDVAEKTVFYTDLGVTSGMTLGIDDCEKKNKSYDIRTLPEDIWEKFAMEANIRAVDTPEVVDYEKGK